MDSVGAFRAFVEAHLPAPPGRVLEVGCGRGDLARSVARLGYSVRAIDPEAPPGAMFSAVTLEEFSDPGPFDAVLANLALHHIHDLSAALAKIRRLLRPGGRLILNELAWDRFDEPTARWYLEQDTAIGHDAPRSVEQCLDAWAADHAGLHSSAAMRSELGRCFAERFFAWMPSLNRELGDAVDEREERALIDAGAIQATGFRYVGERASR
jgi:2-polyprenyl-3-methyl-5-hydroxy-6-metoxy-1,4-benzoquinol methylase